MNISKGFEGRSTTQRVEKKTSRESILSERYLKQLYFCKDLQFDILSRRDNSFHSKEGLFCRSIGNISATEDGTAPAEKLSVRTTRSTGSLPFHDAPPDEPHVVSRPNLQPAPRRFRRIGRVRAGERIVGNGIKGPKGKNLAPIGARLAEERQRTSIPPGLSTNLSPVLPSHCRSQECCFEDEHLILGMTAPNKRVASRNRLAVGQRVHPMLFPFSIVL